MDDLDRRLIRFLEVDARTPIKSLAAMLGVSRATVQNRLARLQASGAVQGFTVRLGQPADAGSVRAVMNLATDHARPERLLTLIRRMPGVDRVHTTNGEWDLIIEICCPDLRVLDSMIDQMRTTAGVIRTQTLLLLNSYGALTQASAPTARST